MKKIKVILVGILIGIIITGFLIITLPYRISNVLSTSMEPTLLPGETVIVKTTDKITRGQVVAFLKTLGEERSLLVKRVAGVEGDYMYCDGEFLWCNGEKLTTCEVLFEYIVPEDCFFMLGDNSADSYDSRYWDDPWVQTKDLIGVVVRKINGWKEVE